MKVSSNLNHLIPKDMVGNLKLRAKIHRLVMDHPEYADVFVDACAADPLFFIDTFCFTLDPRREPFTKLPFILYDFQEETVLELIKAVNHEDMQIEKSRDMGVSWITLAALFWCWRFKGGLSFLLGSRVDDYVDKAGNPKSLFYKFDYILKNLPVWLQPKGFSWNEHRRQSHIENPENGSVVDGESTTKNFAAGDRRTAIMLDEFARVDIGHSILSATRDVTRCRLYVSTPFGINNAFYDLKNLPIKRLRLHWTQHPEKAAGLYKKEKDEYIFVDKEYWDKQELIKEQCQSYDQMIIDRNVPLPDDKLRSPWYAEQCKRAASAQEIAQEVDIDYLGSGHQFFNSESVQETIRKYTRPPLLVGDLEYDHQTGEPIRFRESQSGKFKLWFTLDGTGKPSIGDHRSSLGCDISAGTGASNSTACGWDEATQEKLCEYTNPHIRPEEFAKQVKAIAAWLGGSHVLWESNGPGRQFGSRLLELGYTNVYLRQNDQAIGGRVSDIPGLAATREAKLMLLGQYRDVIETGECINYSKEALEETLEYVYSADGQSIEHSRALNKEDPSGARANHGDRVIADALAFKGITYQARGPKTEEIEIPIGCRKWRDEQRKKLEQHPQFELSPAWRN